MRFFPAALACAVITASSSSFATTLNLTKITTLGFGWSGNYSLPDTNLQVTAYSGGYSNAANQEQGSDIKREQIAALSSYGLGIERLDMPNLPVDNKDGNFDMFLFTFDHQVKLESIGLGWSYNDSDMTVLAYTGSGNATSLFSGNNWSQALASDWSGRHYLDVANGPNGQAAVNPDNFASSSWLIGTQLWALKNLPTSALFGDTNKGTDYVTLKNISYTVASVPEVNGAASGIALSLLAALMTLFKERGSRLSKRSAC